MATTPPSSASYLLIILVLVLALAASAVAAGNGSCIPAERAALLSFKAGITSDPANLLGSWHGRDCCQWSGVTCSSRTGHVVQLDLYNQFLDDYGRPTGHSLRGQISSSLLSLRHLKHLDLSANNNLGEGMPIPDFLGSFHRLELLDLSYMNFIGSVPPSLGNLSKLTYLDIQNYFGTTYSDISWLPRLHSLQALGLARVNLSSAVDWFHMLNALPSLSILNLAQCGLNRLSYTSPLLPHNLTGLVLFDISNNHFAGPFPDELGNFTLLEMLHMSNNTFEGMIPATLQTLCSLSSLDIGFNNIGRDITDLIERLPSCSLKSFQYLFLREANITGTALKWALNLTGLNALDVGFNHLSGFVPAEIGRLKNLVTLIIDGNNITGEISEDHFSSLTNLKIIDFSYLHLEFVVGSDWVPPFNLQQAWLGSCHLGPRFPEWLRWQKGMLGLDISDAGIIDRIPHWFWTTFSDAVTLDLSSNQISGELPINLEFMLVKQLSLQSNCITGSIPHLPRTTLILDLSKNSLRGFVPSNFRAPKLQIVVLFSNRITGTIPESICHWPELKRLDLASNLLVGELPDCGRKEMKPWNLPSSNSSRVQTTSSSSLEITTLLLSNNSLSGGFPRFLRQCRKLISLDLAQNKLSGELSAWISEHMPALVMLRLRSNNLSGRIQNEVMELPALRILDLSNNAFSGDMPQSFANLKALATTHDDSNTIENPFELAYHDGNYKLQIGQFNDSLQVVIKGQVLGYNQNTIYLMSIDVVPPGSGLDKSQTFV